MLKGRHWKLSSINRENISKSHRGEKSYLWKGGISFAPYTLDWTKSLKQSIRERDHFSCRLCGKPQAQENKILSVHHIDYCKENCNPDNLITLCQSCHSKTNNNRDYWLNYFKNGR